MLWRRGSEFSSLPALIRRLWCGGKVRRKRDRENTRAAVQNRPVILAPFNLLEGKAR